MVHFNIKPPDWATADDVNNAMSIWGMGGRG